MIISAAQNSEPEVERFEYPKPKQDELIDYFKLTPAEWEAWNRERHGDDRSKWRPPLKILIVCDRLLTGFDAPVEQVMYLDKPLRDHNLLQAIARTNRPLPAMKKRTGVVVDYFGVFTNLEKALNFDESIREESLIDWDALRATVPGEVARCMELFDGITIADTRECLLAALRRLRDPEAAKNFEHNFRSLERLWEAVAPDPCLYPHRHQYNWLCGIYVAHRRRQRGSKDTYGELSAKTRQLIQENTTFIDIAEALPVFKIDKDYVTKLDELPTPADKAAALEAILTGELSEDDPSFIYRQLGERLQRVKERKDAGDEAAAQRLRELEEIAAAAAATEAGAGAPRPDAARRVRAVHDPARARASAPTRAYVADCARRMVAHLRTNQLLAPGWSNSNGGRMRVEQSLLAESWNPPYDAARLRSGCCGSAVPEAGRERAGQGRWGRLRPCACVDQHQIRLGGRVGRLPGGSARRPPASCACGWGSTVSRSCSRSTATGEECRHSWPANERLDPRSASSARAACGTFGVPIGVPAGEILFRGEPTPVRIEATAAHCDGNCVRSGRWRDRGSRGSGSRTPVARSLENWLRRQARARDREAPGDGHIAASAAARSAST